MMTNLQMTFQSSLMHKKILFWNLIGSQIGFRAPSSLFPVALASQQEKENGLGIFRDLNCMLKK